MNTNNGGLVGLISKLTLPGLRAESVGLLIARIATFGLILHGLHKASGFSGFVNGAMATNPVSAGAPGFFGFLVVAGQILLPIALLIGLFTRIAGILMALLFAFIIGAVNIPSQGIIGNSGGLTFESSLFYMVPGIVLFLTGGGRYSIDALINRDRVTAEHSDHEEAAIARAKAKHMTA